MPDKAQQKHRTNRVFKSLHKPLTYLGVERTLFYFVCVGAVGAFNLFNSILAGNCPATSLGRIRTRFNPTCKHACAS
jgi:hypothetical protein